MDKASGRVKAANAINPPIMSKADEERKKRLAEALRDNLRRRKQQAGAVKPPPR